MDEWFKEEIEMLKKYKCWKCGEYELKSYHEEDYDETMCDWIYYKYICSNCGTKHMEKDD